MLGSLAPWWNGKQALDGGPVHVSPSMKGPARSDAAKDEMFGHLRVKVRNNPEAVGEQSRKRTDLVAFNDGYAPRRCIDRVRARA